MPYRLALASLSLFLMVGEGEAAPASLVRAIIHVESGGKANVTGRAGEIGLMQIKLRTAQGMGYRGTRRGLYDPVVNVRWGTKYLDRALTRARGNLCIAASLYQSGLAGRLRCSAYGRKVLKAMRR